MELYGDEPVSAGWAKARRYFVVLCFLALPVLMYLSFTSGEDERCAELSVAVADDPARSAIVQDVCR